MTDDVFDLHIAQALAAEDRVISSSTEMLAALRARGAASKRSRSALSLFAGVAGVAVVIVSVIAFAIELNDHRPNGGSGPGPAAIATATPEATPTGLPTLAQVPASAKVLLPLTQGNGSMTLPAFTLDPHSTLYVEDGCVSSSTADTMEVDGGDLAGDDVQYQCSHPGGASGESAGAGGDETAGGVVTLNVIADPTVSWELVVFEGPAWTSPPSASPGPPSGVPGLLLPPGSRILIPWTDGAGSSSLPTFMPTETYLIAYRCSETGPVTVAVVTTGGAGAPGTCGGTLMINGVSPPSTGTPVDLSVTAAPSKAWAIMVYEVP
jgi:hypothetical protein